MLVEQGATGEFDGLANGGQRDASATAHVADEIPRMSVRYVVQDLPDHDTGAFEGGLAVADERVGHNVFAKFEALGFAVGFGFHVVVENCAMGGAIWQACAGRRPAQSSSRLQPTRRRHGDRIAQSWAI